MKFCALVVVSALFCASVLGNTFTGNRGGVSWTYHESNKSLHLTVRAGYAGGPGYMDSCCTSGTSCTTSFLKNYGMDNDINKIVVEDGVKSIGDSCFYGVDQKKEDGGFQLIVNSHLERIDTAAFMNSKIAIVKFNKDVDQIALNAFYGGEISVLTVADGAHVSYINNSAFLSLKVPKLVLRGDDIHLDYGAFQYSSVMTEARIEGTLVEIGKRCFLSCSELATFSVDKFTGSIPDQAFSSTKMNSIIIKSGSIENIDGNAFFLASSKELNIYAPVGSINETAFQESKFEKICIKSISSITCNTFKSANALKTLVINSSTSIGARAFYDKTNLESVTIKGDVDSIGDFAFHGCSNLKEVIIEGSLGNIGNYAFYGCSKFERVSYATYNVKSIGEKAFYGCDSLTTVTVRSGVTTVGNGAFGGCNSLTSIQVEKGNDNYVSVDGILLDAAGSTLLQYPCGKQSYSIPDGVTSINDFAFSGCSGLTSMTIPADISSIGNGAFSSCNNLKSFIIENGNTKFKSDAGVLLDSTGSTLIQYACGLSQTEYTIAADVRLIQEHAFDGCKNLASFALAQGNKNLKVIEGVLFDKDVKTLLKFPEGHTAEYYAIPDTITSIKSFTISSSHVKSVFIPEAVKTIETEAFYTCENLNYILYQGSETISTVGIAFSCHKLYYTCASPDYEFYMFGEIPLDIKSGVCTNFRNKFNHCYYPVLTSDGSYTIEQRRNATEWINQPSDCVVYGCDNKKGKTKTIGSCSSNTACYVGGGTCNEQTGFCEYQMTEEYSRLSNQENACYERICTNDGWIVQVRKNATDWEKQSNECILYECVNASGGKSSYKVTCNDEPEVCYLGICDNETGTCAYEKVDKWYKLIKQEDRCNEVVCEKEGWALKKRDDAMDWEKQTNGCVEYSCEGSAGFVSKRICNSSTDVSRVCIDGASCISNWKSDLAGSFIGIEFDGLYITDLNISEMIENISDLCNILAKDVRFGTDVDDHGKLLALVISFEDESITESAKETIMRIIESGECQSGVLCDAESVDVYHNEEKSESKSSGSRSEAQSASESKVQSTSESKVHSASESKAQSTSEVVLSGSSTTHNNKMVTIVVMLLMLMVMMI